MKLCDSIAPLSFIITPGVCDTNCFPLSVLPLLLPPLSLSFEVPSLFSSSFSLLSVLLSSFFLC